MGQSASDLTKIKCACGASLKVPKSAVGKKAKCPKCSKVFVIAVPPTKEDSVFGLAAEPDSSSFLDDLASLERGGTKIEEEPKEGRKVRCAKCGEDMQATARICTKCGYDIESGRTLTAAKPAKSSSPSLIKRLSGAMGGLMMGTLLSGAGAAIGAAVWAVIAISSGFEIGWIAIGIGALAGYGMLLGYPARNTSAGFIAACMALSGIFLGKIFIFVFLMNALVTGDTDDIEIQRVIVADVLAEERLSEQGIWGVEREEQWESVFDDAYEDVEGWSKERVRTRAAEAKAEQERQNAYSSEEGRQIIRVARHRAARRADDLGLTADHPDHEKLYAEEFDECKNFSEAQFADEFKMIDDWQKVGRWENENYVQNHLIDQFVDKAVSNLQVEKQAETPDEYWEPSEEESERIRESAKAEVADLSPDARLTRSRSMAAEQERADSVSTLAYHFAARRGDAAGLSSFDPERDVFLKEETERYEALDDGAIEQATATLTAWQENDKWSDDAYVRDNLIYMFAGKAISKQRQDEHSEDEEFWTPSTKEWNEFHAAAAEEVDAISPSKRAQRIRDEKAQRARVWEERQAADDREQDAEAASDTMGAFFAMMFGPIDGLFLLLAVSAAWRIALGGSDD